MTPAERMRAVYYRNLEASRAKKRSATARWRSLNPDKNREISRKAYSKNPAYFTNWRERNREKVQAAGRRHAKLNPAQMAAKAAARRAAHNLRTPSWSDATEIAAVYARARRLTIETGTLHHVDHDLPLLGKRVSGLHVAANLKVVPAAVNYRKSNTFEPE